MTPGPANMMFWVVYRFALGFLVATMYAFLLRRDWTSGPKTAACAGIIVWFAAAGLNNVVLGAFAMVWSVVAIRRLDRLPETTVAGLLAGRVYGEAVGFAGQFAPAAGAVPSHRQRARRRRADCRKPRAELARNADLPPAQHLPRTPHLRSSSPARAAASSSPR